MKKIFVFNLIWVLPLILLANDNNNWKKSLFEDKVFIENNGQFDTEKYPFDSKVKFYGETNNCQLIFSEDGLDYRFEYYNELPKKQKGDPGKSKRPMLVSTHDISIKWLGKNPDAKVIAQEKVNEKYIYNFNNNTSITASAYKKIIYKNLYPKIDVEYIFHPNYGIKYNIILHPGANPSLIKMEYSNSNLPFLDLDGNVVVNHPKYKLIDNAPVTFYNDNQTEIKSHYIITNNVVSFNLDGYDNTKEVVIDPWTTTITTLTNNNRAFDVGKDAAGNIYVAGGKGTGPNGYKLAKFSAAGVLIWTANTLLDGYYGDMVVDPAGNCYVAEGAFTGRVRKFNTAGTQVWATSVHSGTSGYEVWALAMNDAGTSLIAAWIDNSYTFGVGYLNMGTGAITSFSSMGMSNTEIRALCFDPANNIFGLTCNFSSGSIGNRLLSATGALTQNYFVSSTYNWEEWSTTYSNTNNYTGSGVNAVCADANFVYTTNGAILHKRNKATGAILATATIPNGVFELNGGIAVDACGTIFAGSRTGVYEFDNSLTQTNFVSTPNDVYDVKLGNNLGEILACGKSFVSSLSFTPCTSICDATITQVGPFCVNTPSINLTAVQSGGTWSGTGITNTTNGTFDPTTAGTGNWVITYTLPTCNDTVAIVVNPNNTASAPSTTPTLCMGTAISPNITHTTTGATGIGVATGLPTGVTANWSGGVITISGTPSVSGSFNYSIPLTGGCGTVSATGTITVTPLPNSGGDGTVTFCPTNPATALFNYLSGMPNNGGVWTGPSALTNGDQGTFNPATNTAGIYTYTVTNSCGTTSNTVTVTISPNPVPGTNGTAQLCANAININLFDSLGGSPNAGGAWSPALSSGTGVFNPATDAPGVYTYSINNCLGSPQTATVTVSVTPLPNSGGDSTVTFCPTNPATALFNYLSGMPNNGGVWTGPSALTNGDQGTFNPATNTAGIYTYTVTNSCGTASNTVTVTINSCTLPAAGYMVNDSVLCKGECVTFTNVSTNATSWLWTFEGGIPSSANTIGPHTVCFDIDGTHNIKLVVSNSNGSDSTTSSIIVHPNPLINAGNDVSIKLGQSTNLNAFGTNGNYTWSPTIWLDCISCSNPISTPEETTTYTVIVVDSNGCTASDDITVIVDFEYVIWVPNIFSPNGDGNNDLVYVRGKGIHSLQFFIYDRWGEKVFETADINIGWDGTFRGQKMNNAVFVFYLEATFLDGSEVSKKGDITLIR